MTYEIFEAHLETLLARVNKLNAKLVRIGATPATVRTVGQRDTARDGNPNIVDRIVTIEVSTATPAINGWQFVAKIVHTPDGNVVNHVPGTGELPAGYREGKPACDHCHTNRFRRDTYIVRRDSDTRQVGSSCLEEFLGTKNPQILCAEMDLISDIHEACDATAKSRQPLDRSVGRIPLARFLGCVAELTLKSGYLTRSDAARKYNDRSMSTSSQAYRLMFETVPGPVLGTVVPAPISEEAVKLAETAREFVVNKFSPQIPDVLAPAVDIKAVLMQQYGVQSRLSDFEHNLYTLARSEAIEPRLCGIAAYIVEFYRRAQQALRPVPQVNLEGLSVIFSMFTTAAKNLKRPAIRLADEAGTHLHLSLAGTASKNAGCIYVKADSGFGAPYYGKITPQGKWFGVRECPPAVEPLLMTFAASPEEIASKYGKLTGCCSFCGRKLTDARSTAVGYGPVCADKFGLDWGSHKHVEAAISDAEAAAANVVAA